MSTLVVVDGTIVCSTSLIVPSALTIHDLSAAIAPDAVPVISGAELIVVHVALAPLPPEVNTCPDDP